VSRQGRRSLRPENADECGAGAAWSNDSGTFGPLGGNTSRGRASSSFSPFQLEAHGSVVDAAPVGGVHVVASQANRAWIAACRSPRVAVSGTWTLRQDGGFCRHPSPRSGHGHPRPNVLTRWRLTKARQTASTLPASMSTTVASRRNVTTATRACPRRWACSFSSRIGYSELSFSPVRDGPGGCGPGDGLSLRGGRWHGAYPLLAAPERCPAALRRR
jgi:hypothetical protein